MELSPLAKQQIESAALDVWKTNDVRGEYLQPHPSIYKYRWQWDSAFHTMGMRHYDSRRAAREVAGIFEGQWASGMIPNVQYVIPGGAEERLWASRDHRFGPKKIGTSGITQPPVVAEAVWKAGLNLGVDERRAFWSQYALPLVRYHEWIYRDRTHGDALFAAVHPWETGMDNKTSIMEHCKTLEWGGFVTHAIARASQSRMFRRDLREVDAAERSTPEEGRYQALALISLLKNRLDADRIRDRHPLHYQGVGINSMFIRNNGMLQRIAEETNTPLPEPLLENMQATERDLELLWNEQAGTYYSRDAVSGRQIPIQTLSSTMPLYAGIELPGERAEQLYADVTNPNKFWTKYGLPNAPLDYEQRREKGYWQEMWTNTDYIGVTMLDEHGYSADADELAGNILTRIYKNGMYEYFNARTGEGLGVRGFGWTAMLALDLLKRESL